VRGPARARARARGKTQACQAQAGKRSVIILPGLGNSASDYDDLAENLRSTTGLDLNVHTCDVRRIDWLRNAAGLLDPAYWKGTLKPRPVVDWYLDKVKEKVEIAKRDGGPVSFLAHSAGGWLGRTYLVSMEAPEIANVDCFVSLGSPHMPPPKDVIDQTRGILTWVNETTPGAFHDSVKYTTISGTCIQGTKFGDEDASLEQKITGQGYKQVGGNADVWGDGIVPKESAHLEGALQINLEGVYHSPLGQGDRKWYGSPEVIGEWYHHLDP